MYQKCCFANFKLKILKILTYEKTKQIFQTAKWLPSFFMTLETKLMQPNIIARAKYVGDKIVCRYCYENCVKHGRFSGKKR